MEVAFCLCPGLHGECALSARASDDLTQECLDGVLRGTLAEQLLVCSH